MRGDLSRPGGDTVVISVILHIYTLKRTRIETFYSYCVSAHISYTHTHSYNVIVSQDGCVARLHQCMIHCAYI